MRSTSCSSYQSGGLTYQSASASSDRRYPFDSGGRPNGTPGSRPTITNGPANPCSRRVTAAFPPASPPPTIKNRPLSVSIRMHLQSLRGGMSNGSKLGQTLGEDDARSRLDQREVRERLREVAEVAPGARVELLGV